MKIYIKISRNVSITAITFGNVLKEIINLLHEDNIHTLPQVIKGRRASRVFIGHGRFSETGA